MGKMKDEAIDRMNQIERLEQNLVDIVEIAKGMADGKSEEADELMDLGSIDYKIKKTEAKKEEWIDNDPNHIMNKADLKGRKVYMRKAEGGWFKQLIRKIF